MTISSAGGSCIPCRPDAVDEGHRRRVREAGERRRRLMREARGGVLRVADGDLLEILDAPQNPVLANGTKIKAGHAERLGAHWPAAGFVDIEIRCSTGLESWNATTEVQPRVQA